MQKIENVLDIQEVTSIGFCITLWREWLFFRCQADVPLRSSSLFVSQPRCFALEEHCLYVLLRRSNLFVSQPSRCSAPEEHCLYVPLRSSSLFVSQPIKCSAPEEQPICSIKSIVFVSAPAGLPVSLVQSKTFYSVSILDS